MDEEQALHDALLREGELLGDPLYGVKAAATPPPPAARRMVRAEVHRDLREDYDPIGGVEVAAASQSGMRGASAYRALLLLRIDWARAVCDETRPAAPRCR